MHYLIGVDLRIPPHHLLPFASRVIHDLGTSSSWRSPLTSSKSIARCAETASHKANNAQKVPTRLSQNCVWVLTEAGIIALVKNRTFDMTIVIGDGANDVSMIQMVDVAVGISG
ncbi:hypothetical protein IGI04_039229 [Brassica rapa subsp. trilocularis]|uniref:P-type ATPase C-terminal domain-containing protein n=1 Tax=Brassica rapa subsp. trilocularis TaxID=1813537 RepID=A0ABQ7KJA2_BRACM|nr:hypothetical protein IGI04_039229 [Brassica rapa subsp. trilocularis]